MLWQLAKAFLTAVGLLALGFFVEPIWPLGSAWWALIAALCFAAVYIPQWVPWIKHRARSPTTRTEIGPVELVRRVVEKRTTVEKETCWRPFEGKIMRTQGEIKDVSQSAFSKMARNDRTHVTVRPDQRDDDYISVAANCKTADVGHLTKGDHVVVEGAVSDVQNTMKMLDGVHGLVQLSDCKAWELPLAPPAPASPVTSANRGDDSSLRGE